MLVDSHFHLDLIDPAERDAVIRRAHDAGVGELVTIGTSLAQSEIIRDHAERVDRLWCTVGVHPQNAGEHAGECAGEHARAGAIADRIVALTAHPKVIGIGETGLDYHYETASAGAQQASFRAHLAAAQATGLPVAIHARDADDDILRILREARADGPFGFLLHCFTAGRALAEAAVAMGGYVSFSGILTFPKSIQLREIARGLPIDRLLVETDAPYLAPAPHRGRRNEPAWVTHTAATLAELHGLDPAALADRTTANFRRLFPRAVVPAAACA